jgi:hypothetical protein
VAVEAPALLAAFSILPLHIPQLPDTGMVSVFAFCANEIVVKAINIVAKENILSVFMIVCFEILKKVKNGDIAYQKIIQLCK